MKLALRSGALVCYIVLCILFPVIGDAGQFFIRDVWYVKTEGVDRTHVRVGSQARYEGALDINDHDWAIEAHLFVGGVTYYGFPKSGGTIDPNMGIELSYVESRHRDRHGNQFRYKSTVRLRRSTTQAADVFLLSQ